MFCTRNILKLECCSTVLKRNFNVSVLHVSRTRRAHQSFAFNCKRSDLFIYTKRKFSCIKVSSEQIRDSLSAENKQRFIERLKNAENIEKDKLQSCTEEASVLVPFCMVDSKPSMLFTLRSETLVSHRGQVSFPGGKRDKEDKSVIDTAVRETEEELGIPRNIIDVWGSAQPMPDRVGRFAVTPVIAFLGAVNVEKIPCNHDEVSLVFTVTLDDMCDPRNHRYTDHKLDNGILRRPIFLTEHYRIWGLTAVLMDFVLAEMFPGYYKQRSQIFSDIQHR